MKISLPELFFETDKRLKSVFYRSKRKPVYGLDLSYEPQTFALLLYRQFLVKFNQDLSGIKGYNIVFQVVFQHISPA